MYTISKEFHFSASHILNGLAEGHSCGRLHGHNYVAVIYLQGMDLNKLGFIRDYGELKPVKEFIDNTWDHRHLNDVYPFDGVNENIKNQKFFSAINPSAENMARELFDKFSLVFPELYAVEVKETPKTCARYEG